jgi:murein endopeptidase/LysM repeat protein
MRSRWMTLLALVIVGSMQARAGAVPPPGVALSALSMPRPSWVQVRVVPGDRVVEIANRYAVSADDVMEWNQLDAKHPLLRVGQSLRLLTPVKPVERHLRRYRARRGDTWAKIATQFGVDKAKLRKEWNPAIEELKTGDRLELWVEEQSDEQSAESEDEQSGHFDHFDLDFTREGADTEPETKQAAREADVKRHDERPEQRQLVATVSSRSLAREPGSVGGLAREPARPSPRTGAAPRIISVPSTAQSWGSATHGKLLHGVQLPKNDALYSIRNPENTYGSAHAIEQLQRAVARFRDDFGFSRELVIEDMSRQYGGRFKPHHSHRTGRDVDIELPLKPGVAAGIVPRDPELVNWDATWSLVKALIATGEVRYIFLSRPRQRDLYEAAVRDGASQDLLEQYIQYPHNTLTTYVRHAPGHVKHMHVRFTCGADEAQCRD